MNEGLAFRLTHERWDNLVLLLKIMWYQLWTPEAIQSSVRIMSDRYADEIVLDGLRMPISLESWSIVLPSAYEETYNLSSGSVWLSIQQFWGLQNYIQWHKVEDLQTTIHENNLTMISNGNSRLCYMQSAINQKCIITSQNHINVTFVQISSIFLSEHCITMN
jgi:hypothetical protein